MYSQDRGKVLTECLFKDLDHNTKAGKSYLNKQNLNFCLNFNYLRTYITCENLTICQIQICALAADLQLYIYSLQAQLK